jgi:phytoene synthase
MLLHSPDPPDLASDLAACAARLRQGSRSFAAASRLLPAPVRDAATMLYAFCREADDAVDCDGGGAEAVRKLRERLDRVYAGAPLPGATDRALTEVVSRHALPRALLDALIEGFEWDAQNRRYATVADLIEYAARVAGTVGAMMAILMGARTRQAIARACDLGVAMQLTNIARDVGEDARAGRLYLPLDWLREAGIDADDWLAKPSMSDALGGVVRKLLGLADSLYAAARPGVALLPSACRPGIHAARLIYADIGRVIRQHACDSVARRAVVPRHRKAWLLVRAFATIDRPCGRVSWPPLPAARRLVESVTAAAPVAVETASRPPMTFAWWQFGSRGLWLLDLFERMERRERVRSLGLGAG